MFLKNEMIDPYDKPLYQAELIKQESDEFTFANTSAGGAKIKAQKQLTVTIVEGSVEVVYNSNVFSFEDSNAEIAFRREINSFFISNGFILDSVAKPILAFTLIQEVHQTEDVESFLYTSNNEILSSAETETLYKIISYAYLRNLKF